VGGERERARGRGEKWPKHRMHILNKQKKKKRNCPFTNNIQEIKLEENIMPVLNETNNMYMKTQKYLICN
jgi:translation elongation factor P/translation initiation factor 5A